MMFANKYPFRVMASGYPPVKAILVAAALLFFPCSANSWAAVREVTLFPQAARVTEVTSLKLLPEGKDFRKAVLTLPGQADPASLVTYPPREARLRIEEQSWRSVPFADDPKVKELQKQINLLQEEKNKLEASRLSLETQIQFWQQQIKTRVKNLTEAGNVAAAIGRNIKKAFQEKLQLAPEIVRLDKRIKELQEGWKLLDPGHRQRWEITMLFSHATAAETILTYSYTLKDCGWQPAYRLDAQPEKGEIRFGWEAEVWQNSGENWKEVQVTLAHGAATYLLMPPEIRPWIINLPPGKKTKGKRTGDKASAVPPKSSAGIDQPEASLSSFPDPSPLPLRLEGKKTFFSGSRQKVKIREETWPAAFSYLARPSESLAAFIYASLRSPEGRYLPVGKAMFMLNGALLGQQAFLPASKEETIFFGPDPLITAAYRTGVQEGKKDDHREKNPFEQERVIELENSHAFSIRLRLEEPIPNFSDERIRGTLQHRPNPSAQTATAVIWEIELAAGERKSVFFGVKLE